MDKTIKAVHTLQIERRANAYTENPQKTLMAEDIPS